MWCSLFFTMLQNEIQDFFLCFEHTCTPCSTLGSERVKTVFLLKATGLSGTFPD